MRPSWTSALLAAIALTFGTAANATPVFVSQWGSYGNGPGQFDQPSGICVDASGNVYVADAGNNRIQKFSGGGVYLGQFGVVGTGAGQFMGPMDCAVDAAGTIYVSDVANQRIQVFDSSFNWIRQWPTLNADPAYLALDPTEQYLYVSTLSDSMFKYRISDGVRLAAWQYTSCCNKYGFAVGPSGSVYASSGLFFVRKDTPDGALVAVWGGSGSGPGQFSSSKGVGVTSDERVYVGDGNARIQTFTSTGTYLESWGYDAPVSSGVTDISTQADGVIFVLDGFVRKFVDVSTATKSRTWGSLKARYRTR